MHDPPSGTVTFLFADVDRDAGLLEQSEAMEATLSQQEAILRAAAEAHNGYVYKVVGSSFQVAFHTAAQAVEAALQAQRALSDERWMEGVGHLRVRMSLHTGVTEERGTDYFGPILNRAARLMSAAHGGQVLLTQAAAELARTDLPAGVTLRDLGEHRLRDLTHAEHIFQLVAEGLASDFPPPRTLPHRPNNLPLQPTPLVGRDAEVPEICGKLQGDNVTLLTLTGPGGIGKTRLAIQAAAEMLDSFEEGLLFVSLASVSDPDLVVPAIAYAFGLRESGGESVIDTLKAYLKEKKLLLVIDNFEQVLAAAVELGDLLASARYVKAIVTSRAALHISLEYEYAVPPMTVPDPKKLPAIPELLRYEAVSLFVQRAGTVNPAFRLDSYNAAAVAEICRRLDGMPLAIELAAARAKSLTPQALLARLGSRLKLLTGGARDLPARQQTLRDTIAWSYDLLTPPEQTLFVRLGVFAGGCTLEAAEEVCNAGVELDVLDGISSLVDKSLLRQQAQEDGDARFDMLETIREYAAECLEQSGEAEDLRSAHFNFFLRLAETAEPELKGADQDVWLQRLEEEHSNMRAALEWSLRQGTATEADPDGSLLLAGALHRFWFMHSHLSEGCRWLSAVLEKSNADPPPASPQASQAHKGAQAKVLNGMGILTWLQGDLDEARRFYEQSLEHRRELADERGVSMALNNLAVLAEEVGDYNQARSLLEESLVLKRKFGDKAGIASSLSNLGSVTRELGDPAGAHELFMQSLALEKELGNKMHIAGRLNDLANLAFDRGDFEASRLMHREGLAIKEAQGDRWGMATSFANLAYVLIAQGDNASAGKLLADSLLVRQEIGNRSGYPEVLEGYAWLALEMGEPQRAARLYSATNAVRVLLDVTLPSSEREFYERNLARVREQLDTATFAEEWEKGQAMTLEQVLAYLSSEEGA